jgi:hypothetical protein
MPVYKVEAPDGQIIKVEAPEGASQADILAFAEENYKPKAPEPKESVLRQAADIPVNFAKGISQGVRMLSDAFGADNAVSANLRGVEDYLGNLLSAQAKNDQQAIASIFKEAEDKGVLDQVKAGLKAFATAPVDIMSQAFGTIIPTLAGGLAGKVIGIGARAAGVGTGAVMGTGAGKSAIYDAVTEELKQAGLPPEAIQQAATQAQEYGGKNLDLILANTLLGGVAAGTGIERALIPGMVKNMSANIAKRGALGRGLATGAPELLTEGAQGGTEQLSQNVALQREGFDVPTFRGVGTATTMEAVAGGVLGGGIGAFSRPQAAPVATPDDSLNAIPAQDFTVPPAAPPIVPPAPLMSQDAIDRQASYEQQMAIQNARQEQAVRGNQFMTTPSPYLSQGEAAIQPGQRERAQGLAAQQFGLSVGDARAPITEQDRIDRQIAAQQQMDADRFQQQTPQPLITPAQALPRIGSPTPTPQTARAFDRQADLLGQMQGLPQVEQTGLAAQADIAGRTGQVATPKTGFVALEPMTPREARQRLAVLKEDLDIQDMPAELAQFRAQGLQGPIPKGLREPTSSLHIVPHPTVGGRYAIEQRVKPTKEAPEPRRADRAVPSVLQTFNLMERLKNTGVITPEAFAAAQRYGFNINAPIAAFQQKQTAPDIITQQRQGMADEAALNAELRGGVATPEEAQRLFETGMGRPYDAIQQTAPQSRELGLSERERRLNTEEAAAQEKANRDPEAIARRRFQEKLQGPEVDFLEGFDVNMNAEPGPASPEFTEQFMKPEGRYSLSGEATPELKATVEDMRKQLLPILKRFGLGNLGLRLVDSIENGKADGMYAQQVITLALDSDNPLGVMRHEVIHALKELGAFTPAEWKVLTKAAKDTWINQFFDRAMQDQYQAVYLEQNGNLDGFQEYLQEEAIAQAFRYFSDPTPKGALNEFQRPSGRVANLMRRLNEFFKAIRDFFASKDLTIDEMFLPNRIFADIERGAIQPGRDKGRKEELPQFAAKFSLRNHAIQIISNKVKKPKIEGKVTVDKVGQYFDNKVMAEFGKKLDYKNQADFDRAVAQAKDEVAFQLKQENSGLDWYEEDIKTAFELTEKAIPELANEQNRILFSVMAGIMSPQTNARDNWFIAAKAFQHYIATGTIPGNNPDTGGLWQGGTQSANKKVQLEFLNKMVADLGQQQALEWLVGQHSVKEVNQFRLKYGNVKSGIGGKATDQVIGLYAFGPKVGPFVSNLNGIFDVTVDKWMTRTFNRYFGTMVDADGKIIDAPTEPQRRAIKQLVNEAAQNANIKPYQVQSLLWFFEQRLFRELGTAAPSYGFSDGGRKFLDSTTGGDEKSGRNAAAKTKKQPAPKLSLRDFGSDKSAIRSGAQGDGTGRDGRAGDKGGSDSPLEGAPSFKGASGPDPRLTETAKKYAKSKGIPFGRQSVYAEADPVFGKRIADAYDEMADDPFNPDVIEAYQDLINQVKEQYNALADAGYQFTFFDSETDPYGGNPVNAMRDLRNNKKMAVYGTYDGYGQTEISLEDIRRNPMLEDTGLRWVDQQGLSRAVLANDLFRAVHDAFGHGLEGAGFRARGEENAFQAHAKLFTGKALGALASETRGQNSWLNFGPFAEQNKNAKVEDTVFAEQKVGLMPSWTWTENIVPDTRYSLRSFDQSALRPSPSRDAGISFNPVKEDAVSFQGSHYGKVRTEVLSGAKYGQGLRGAEARRLEQSDDDRIKRRVYFYIPRGNNTMPNREAGVGSYVYTQKLDNILAPGPTMGRLNQEAGGDANKFESLIVDNGYDGYAVPDFGMMVVLNQDVPVKYEGTVDEVHGGKKTQPKFSLRAPKTPEFKRFFGNSKVVNPDGTPKVMYHGTARIIDEFLPKQAAAIFVTDNPDFAERFSKDSIQYQVNEQINDLRKKVMQMSRDEKLAFYKKAYKLGVKQKAISKQAAAEALNAIEQNVVNNTFPTGLEFKDVSEFFEEDIKNKLEVGQNIMPLYVRAENPFDYQNPKHIAILRKSFGEDESTMQGLAEGDWNTIESTDVQDVILDEGFDGFYVKEGGNKNLAVYNPNQIKSAIGNRGTYDETGRILYSLKNAPPNQYTKLTEDPVTEKTINGVIKSAFNAVSNDGTSLRNALVDKFSQLSKTLSSLPLFNNKGELRGDMLLHSYAQATNLIKAGLVSGTPILNKDGTIGIERSDNNLANAERLADLLDTNKNVVESGLTGRGYIANIARNLRGADIIAEDRAAQQLGAQQLAKANQMYADLNAEIKTGKLSAAAVAKRQKEINKLRKEGKENSRQKRELQVKPEDIAWAERQLQMTPEVQAILDIWKEVNTSLVNLYESTGMIDKETADKYRGQKNYVPLFKSREDLNEEAFFRTGTSPKTASKLKELKGADITRNIWENVTKQYAVMTAAAYENQTRRVSVEQMRSINPDLAQITTKDDPRVNLRFRKDGEDVHAIIENPNDLAAFQSMTYQFGPVMQFFGGFTRLLRAGALINPMFWLRQLIRDPISVSLTGQAGVVTPFHSAKEFINILARNSEEARVLASRGVIGQFDTTVSLNEFLGNVGKDKQAAPGLMQKSIQRLMEIHEASDAATRVSVYKKAKAKALKDGMSEAQAVDYAVFKARESINFALTGNSPALAAARQLIPFLNATIVGLDTLYRAATGYGLSPEEKAKAKSAFRTRASIMVMMSVAYAALMGDDEEYNKLPDYVKDGNWLFPIIGLDGKKTFIKIPVPYEVGYLFKTLPEVAMRYLQGNSTGKEVAKSIRSGLIQNLPTGGTPIPQFAKPALEVVTNHSFFTGTPIESPADARLPVAQRGRKASEVSKALSEAGLDKIGLSPAKIDTLVKGYFAEFGNFFNELSDAVIAVGSGKERTAKDLEDLPFLKSFMADPQADKAVSTFYDHRKTATEVANSFNDMKKEGRVEELQALIADPEKRKMIAAAPALTKISDVMSTLNRQIRIIDRDQSKSPAERRQLINELEQKRNEIANRGVQIARELGL